MCDLHESIYQSKDTCFTFKYVDYKMGGHLDGYIDPPPLPNSKNTLIFGLRGVSKFSSVHPSGETLCTPLVYTIYYQVKKAEGSIPLINHNKAGKSFDYL